MYELTVQLEFSAAHHLRNYPGKCSRLHGHNYRVEVTISATEVDDSGMLIDFGRLKQFCEQVVDELDHSLLNDHPFFQQNNPTAENIARLIFEFTADHGFPVTKVELWETPNCFATYLP